MWGLAHPLLVFIIFGVLLRLRLFFSIFLILWLNNNVLSPYFLTLFSSYLCSRLVSIPPRLLIRLTVLLTLYIFYVYSHFSSQVLPLLCLKSLALVHFLLSSFWKCLNILLLFYLRKTLPMLVLDIFNFVFRLNFFSLIKLFSIYNIFDRSTRSLFRSTRTPKYYKVSIFFEVVFAYCQLC